MCNPQASFRVLQTLNTVLHGRVVGGRIADVERMSFGVRARLADGGTLLLVLPGLERSGRAALDAALAELGQRATIRYDLATGRVTGATSVAVIPPASDPSEPFVLLAPVDG
jgi:hypothetical protein